MKFTVCLAGLLNLKKKTEKQYCLLYTSTPSVVNIKDNGEIIVGEIAKRQAITNPTSTVLSIKTHMGSDYKVHINGKDYTPQEISAMILKKLKKDAEAYLGEEVKEAVITVPAYFTDCLLYTSLSKSKSFHCCMTS